MHDGSQTVNLTEQFSTLRSELLTRRLELVEGTGLNVIESGVDGRNYPLWYSELSDVLNTLNDTTRAIKHQDSLHNRRLVKVIDTSSLEREIQIHSGRIQDALVSADRDIKNIGELPLPGGKLLKVIRQNAIKAAASKLIEVSENFRRSQDRYLTKLYDQQAQKKEQTVKYDPNTEAPTMFHDINNNHQQQMAIRKEHESTKEVQRLVTSIEQVHTIFQDFAGVMSEQGSLLDRIDFAMEDYSVNIEQGYDQLQKTHEKEKNSFTFKIISALFTWNVLACGILIVKLIWRVL